MRQREINDELSLEASFVYESNLIENIFIPFDQIWRELATFPKTGHCGALVSASFLGKTNKAVTEKMICDWQALIIQEQNSLNLHPENIISGRHIGQYRDCSVEIGGRLCIPPRAVPICMKQLVKEINYFQRGLPDQDEIVKKIADFHFEFLWIHPFADGNGRTSRILAWYLFKYFGLEPFVFTNDDKFETYYKGFDGMREYFKNKFKQESPA